MVATLNSLTLEEFLQHPETKPASEFLNGEVSQKPMPQGEHSTLQGELCDRINQVAKTAKIAYAFGSGRRRNPMRYAVVIEKGTTSYGACVPDLPGCVAVGETLEEVRTLIQEAISFHLEGLQEDGAPIPEPVAVCEYVEAC